MARRKGCASVLLLLVFLVIAGIALYKPVMKRLYPIEYRAHVWEYAGEYRLDPYLVCAVIHTESRFRPEAESHLGAVGLMQVMPDTGIWIGEKLGMDLDASAMREPGTNILLGCWYLRYLLDQFEGNVNLALAAYNGGIGNVRLWLRDPDLSRDGEHLDTIPFTETAKYVEKVMHRWVLYRNLYEDEK